jgi:putative ABC transport system substrate-binding protein
MLVRSGRIRRRFGAFQSKLPFADPEGLSSMLFGVQAITAPVHDTPELESALAALCSYSGTPAARHRLPAVYPFRYFVEFGGLLSYGSDLVMISVAARPYADRILKGAKPGELPVQALCSDREQRGVSGP